MPEQWMQRAFSHAKGQLHRSLGVPLSRRIPIHTLEKAVHQPGLLGRRARAAMNARRANASNPSRYPWAVWVQKDGKSELYDRYGTASEARMVAERLTAGHPQKRYAARAQVRGPGGQNIHVYAGVSAYLSKRLGVVTIPEDNPFTERFEESPRPTDKQPFMAGLRENPNLPKWLPWALLGGAALWLMRKGHEVPAPMPEVVGPMGRLTPNAPSNRSTQFAGGYGIPMPAPVNPADVFRGGSLHR